MENSKKRWSITYTKHIKQKRKVYQDGFLDLHISTNKVNLFDDCDKLLESKILNGEEIVSSGETLTFNGYLVDVGEPEGAVEVEVHHRRPSDSKFNEKERKIAERPKPTLMHRRKFRSPVCSDNKDSVEQSKTRLNNISPSRKIIREFKKSESLRYEALKSCPEIVNTGVTEWHVLYTTRVTQKAKLYHEGFLRLKNSGALGRQIILYDASKNLLNTRFLKKDEIIRSDESVAFDAHLVDIGEPEKQNQVSVDSNAEGNTINFVVKERATHEHQNFFEAKKFLVGKGEDLGSRGISSAVTTKINMAMPQNKPLRDSHQILSILKKPEVTPGRTDKNGIQHVSSADGLQSDAEVDHPKDWLLPQESIQNYEPSENKNNRGSSIGMSCLRGAHLSSGSGSENPDQSHLENTTKRHPIWSNEPLASGFSNLANASIPRGPTDNKMKNSEKHTNERRLDEWPTFDLGY